MTSHDVATEPVFATSGGIVYTGEMIRAPLWRPSFGDPLTGDAYLRVVFLEEPQRVSPQALHDHRIAVYVPGSRSPELDRAEVELRAMREAMGTYASDVESVEALTAEGSEVEERAVGAWAASFREGQVITAPALEIDLEAIFSDGYWSTWCERIGDQLLARAYPDPPIRRELLRIPVRPDVDAPVLVDAVLGGSGDASGFAMDAYGPALGLSSSLAPRVPDLSRCPAINELASMIEQGQAPDDIGRVLAHERGYTYPLATLFLLLHISRGTHELHLRPGHGLQFHDGTALSADVVASTDIAGLRWPTRLWDRIDGIAPVDAATTDANAYLAALAGPIGRADEAAEAAARRLSALRDGLPAMVSVVSQLLEAQTNSTPPTKVAKLTALAEAADVTDAIALARRQFAGPAALADAIALWEAWRSAEPHAAPLAAATMWLREAVIDESADELYLERNGLGSRLHDPSLIVSPHTWASLVEAAALFRRRYADAYRRHHEAFHAEMERQAHAMEGIALKAHALGLLNGITELGPRVGEGLPPIVDELHNEVAACGTERTEDQIAQAPLCPACGLHLGAEPPSRDVEQLAAYVDEALGVQNRRLATLVAHRFAGRPGHEALDRFVGVSQVSDLSGLANVLDDELTGFITTLLQETQPGSKGG